MSAAKAGASLLVIARVCHATDFSLYAMSHYYSSAVFTARAARRPGRRASRRAPPPPPPPPAPLRQPRRRRRGEPAWLTTPRSSGRRRTARCAARRRTRAAGTRRKARVKATTMNLGPISTRSRKQEARTSAAAASASASARATAAANCAVAAAAASASASRVVTRACAPALMARSSATRGVACHRMPQGPTASRRCSMGAPRAGPLVTTCVQQTCQGTHYLDGNINEGHTTSRMAPGRSGAAAGVSP